MASNSISNSPIKRVIFVNSDNKQSIDNSPVKRIVLVDSSGQPVTR